MRRLLTRHNGDTLLKLLGMLRGKLQFNGSIGIMPDYLRDVLEPNVATMDERLEVLQVLQAMGVHAESLLCQPLILIYLTPESVEPFMERLAAAGVVNIKPEFFTAEVKNLTLVAQFINHFNPELLKDFSAPYLAADDQTHLKQRLRRAPDRAACVEKLDMIRNIAAEHGITISICNWVKRELSKHSAWVRAVDTDSAAAGYRCLGYQTHLFRDGCPP